MQNRIAEIRNSLNLTQKEFAKQLGLSRNYIWMIENGRRVPPDRTITDICMKFGVSELWLKTGEGDMKEKRSLSDEIGLLVSDIMSDSDESFRKRFIAAILQIPPDGWDAVEDFIKKL